MLYTLRRILYLKLTLWNFCFLRTTLYYAVFLVVYVKTQLNVYVSALFYVKRDCFVYVKFSTLYVDTLSQKNNPLRKGKRVFHLHRFSHLRDLKSRKWPCSLRNKKPLLMENCPVTTGTDLDNIWCPLHQGISGIIHNRIECCRSIVWELGEFPRNNQKFSGMGPSTGTNYSGEPLTVSWKQNIHKKKWMGSNYPLLTSWYIPWYMCKKNSRSKTIQFHKKWLGIRKYHLLNRLNKIQHVLGL